MFEKNLHTTVLFDIYGDMLTSQQQAVIDMYYNQDLSLAEISEQIGITRQGVQYTLKHGEDALWHMEQVLGLAAQSIRTKQLANELETQIRSLPLPPQAEDKRSYLLELIQKLSAAESDENFRTNPEDESKTTTR